MQQIAAGNSPTLRQAASDVQAAQGALEAAEAYPNPNLSYQATPSSDGSTPGAQGFVIDQSIKTGGKLKLQAAAAQKALDNAKLNLDLVRAAWPPRSATPISGCSSPRKPSASPRRMAHFTDEVYLYQEDLLEHGFAASYDPAILRAQAWTARLAYIQAVQSYIYSWKQLVAAVGLRQLPLSEVAGRIDAFIPYYDYDKTLAYVLQHNSQVFIARNGIDLAKYNLKLAQVTPWAPDVDFQVGIRRTSPSPPQQVTPTAQVGVPIPIWDQNKGAIRSAEAALVRALEEPHRVEVTLTNSLAANYANYKNNLAALEYYRKYILPDQVRAFRGIDERRRFDINALSLTDLATAQQNLSTSVTTYLGILSSLWSSAVSVADLMDTEDLFQMAEPKELPPLPDLEHLPPLPCSHPCARGRSAAAPAGSSLDGGRTTCCPRSQLRPVRASRARQSRSRRRPRRRPRAPARPGETPARLSNRFATRRRRSQARRRRRRKEGVAVPWRFRNPWQSLAAPQQ